MRTFRKYILLLLAMPLLSSCQIYSLIKDATDREEGRIIMKDGTEYAGRVKMPNCNTKKIRIKTENGEKMKLQNTDIALLGVWKKKHTDKCHYLVSLRHYKIFCVNEKYGIR